jgi:hypothetical protein
MLGDQWDRHRLELVEDALLAGVDVNELRDEHHGVGVYAAPGTRRMQVPG